MERHEPGSCRRVPEPERSVPIGCAQDGDAEAVAMKRRWIPPAAVAAIVSLGLAMSWMGEKPATQTSPVPAAVPSPPSPAPPPVSAAPLRVAYPAGKQFTYRWSHQASTEARIGDAPPVR